MKALPISLLLLILVNFAPAWMGIDQVEAGLQGDLRRLHNEERSRRNLQPFRSNASLVRSAKSYAATMATTGNFSHTGLDSSTPDDRMRAAGYTGSATGENIAFGYNSAQEVFDGWMNSSGHRRNIRSRLFNQIGFGKSGTYWVTCFGG